MDFVEEDFEVLSFGKVDTIFSIILYHILFINLMALCGWLLKLAFR